MTQPSKMAEIYARKVIAGTWKIKDVPALWRKQVQDLVKAAKAAEK